MNIPLGKWSGSDSTDALHAFMKEQSDAAAKNERRILWLSIVGTIIGLCSLAGLVLQIWLAFYPPQPAIQPVVAVEGISEQSKNAIPETSAKKP